MFTMKLALFTLATLFLTAASAQVQPQKFKRDGAIPILRPATPSACKLMATILNGLCSFANYDGCEDSISYVQCICSAQNDRTEVLNCARHNLSNLLVGYCPL
ncbi:hypothetical protein KI688_010650 [Linnemannia hyalina]|uniref:Extracellular membrane protein CFEM domain-containing protein n=1 Tax=Linnemannia hyalina TaxID=64524 RepID=A0A9P8BX03_9FUNG|nr:hypothetical protein KI688_010650 [Linnemannia hyalina]